VYGCIRGERGAARACIRHWPRGVYRRSRHLVTSRHNGERSLPYPAYTVSRGTPSCPYIHPRENPPAAVPPHLHGYPQPLCNLCAASLPRGLSAGVLRARPAVLVFGANVQFRGSLRRDWVVIRRLPLPDPGALIHAFPPGAARPRHRASADFAGRRLRGGRRPNRKLRPCRGTPVSLVHVSCCRIPRRLEPQARRGNHDHLHCGATNDNDDYPLYDGAVAGAAPTSNAQHHDDRSAAAPTGTGTGLSLGSASISRTGIGLGLRSSRRLFVRLRVPRFHLRVSRQRIGA
jgi:hypothetical protein